MYIFLCFKLYIHVADVYFHNVKLYIHVSDVYFHMF